MKKSAERLTLFVCFAVAKRTRTSTKKLLDCIRARVGQKSKYRMNKFFLALFVSVSIFANVKAQSKQTISFYVNAYKNLDSVVNFYNNHLERICDGFTVTISTSEITLGDEFHLKIISQNYHTEKDFTFYRVEDSAPRSEICAVVLGHNSNGENYLEIFDCDKDGNLISRSGILFQYWDYVSNYELWRVMRKEK